MASLKNNPSAIIEEINIVDEEPVKEAKVKRPNSEPLIFNEITINDASDQELAFLFIKLYNDRVRFYHSKQKWLIFNGRFWEVDDSDKIWDYMREMLQRLEAKAEEDPRFFLIASKCKNRAKQKSILEYAETFQEIKLKDDEIDKNPRLFNVANGTIELNKNGFKFREHRKEDFISMISPVAFDPGAKAPVFNFFLERIQPDIEMRKYIARILGYAITGLVTEQCFFFFYGEGANGKSIIFDVLRAFAGDYYKKAERGLLTTQRFGNKASNGIADLKGARIVINSEINKQDKLDEALVKDLTGEQTLTARALYENNSTFMNTAKLFLGGNHKPTLLDTGKAMERRIRLIPFEVSIPEEEQDHNLIEKLKAELPGILNFILAGYNDYASNGMQTPERVLAASKDYLKDNDPVAIFITQCCEESGDSELKELHKFYEKFSYENRLEQIGKINFRKMLEEKRYKVYNGNGNKVFVSRLSVSIDRKAEMNEAECFNQDSKVLF